MFALFAISIVVALIFGFRVGAIVGLVLFIYWFC